MPAFIFGYSHFYFLGAYIVHYLRTETSFDSAHFLSGYNGKCKNIHGHTWKIVAEISSEELIKSGECRGMIVDFSDFKKALKDLAKTLDHTFIYEKGTLKKETVDILESEGFSLTPVCFRPTAENFSKHIFECLKQKGFNPYRVYVYETAENCAVYGE